jgi:hypothetical protein
MIKTAARPKFTPKNVNAPTRNHDRNRQIPTYHKQRQSQQHQ